MKIKSSKIFKIIAITLCFLMFFEQSGFAQVAGQLDISGHLTAFRNNIVLDKFRPLHLRYLQYDAQLNNFNLLLDKGNTKNLSKPFVENSTQTLLNYFFIGVTLPNDSFWVNLRPDSPDNVIDPLLAQTDIGKILLEADVQLKKDTARFTSPETPEGKEYWDKLYAKAGQLYGSQNVTIPTLTRPWIVPNEIILRETTDNAYIYKATLKVMLEEDYLKGSAVYSFSDPLQKELNTYASQVLREKIIPKLTQEVNTSKRYASLRQVYYSLILAQWFKERFQGQRPSGAVPSQYISLIDRKNLTNLTSQGSWSKNTYFQQYQKSFKDGEYNFKVPMTTPYGQVIRSYFSGGMNFSGIASAIRTGLIAGLRKLPPSVVKGANVFGAMFNGGMTIVDVDALFPATTESNNTNESERSDTVVLKSEGKQPTVKTKEAEEALPAIPPPAAAQRASQPPVTPIVSAQTQEKIIELASGLGTYNEPDNNDLYRELAQDFNITGSVLDIGSGSNGLPAKGLIEGGAGKVIRLDNSELGKQAKAGGIINQEGDATKLPFEDDSFDAVVFNHSLSFIGEYAHLSAAGKKEALKREDWQEQISKGSIPEELSRFVIGVALKEALRVLKPGGYILIKPGSHVHFGFDVRIEESEALLKELKDLGLEDADINVLAKKLPRLAAGKNTESFGRSLGWSEKEIKENTALRDTPVFIYVRKPFEVPVDAKKTQEPQNPSALPKEEKINLQSFVGQARKALLEAKSKFLYRRLLNVIRHSEKLLASRQEFFDSGIDEKQEKHLTDILGKIFNEKPTLSGKWYDHDSLVQETLWIFKNNKEGFIKFIEAGGSLNSMVVDKSEAQGRHLSSDFKEIINMFEFSESSIQEAAIRESSRRAFSGKSDNNAFQYALLKYKYMSGSFDGRINTDDLIKDLQNLQDSVGGGFKFIKELVEKTEYDKFAIWQTLKYIKLDDIEFFSLVSKEALDALSMQERIDLGLVMSGTLPMNAEIASLMFTVVSKIAKENQVNSFGGLGRKVFFGDDLMRKCILEYANLLPSDDISLALENVLLGLSEEAKNYGLLTFRREIINNAGKNASEVILEKLIREKNQVAQEFLISLLLNNEGRNIFTESELKDSIITVLVQVAGETRERIEKANGLLLSFPYPDLELYSQKELEKYGKIFSKFIEAAQDREFIDFVRELHDGGGVEVFAADSITGKLIGIQNVFKHSDSSSREALIAAAKNIKKVFPDFLYPLSGDGAIPNDLYTALINKKTISNLIDRLYEKQKEGKFTDSEAQFVYALMRRVGRVSIAQDKVSIENAATFVRQLGELLNFINEVNEQDREDGGENQIEHSLNRILEFSLAAPNDYRNSLIEFLTSDKNAKFLSEKIQLVSHLIDMNVSTEIFELIKNAAENTDRDKRLAFYRGIVALVSNKAMIGEDTLEDWQALLSDYIPRFGYWAHRSLVLTHRYLAHDLPLDNQLIKDLRLSEIGITATGEKGIQQLRNIMQTKISELVNERKIDELSLNSPIVDAIIGGIIGFYTATWGHGSGGRKLNEFVAHFNELVVDGLILPLDPAFNQEVHFSVRSLGTIKFTEDEQKKFVEYAKLIQEAAGFSRMPVTNQISQLKDEAKGIIESKRDELTVKLAGADEKAAPGIEKQLEELDNIRKALDKEYSDLLEFALAVAAPVRKELERVIAISLLSKTFSNPEHPNLRDNMLNTLDEGLSKYSLDGIIELKENFIKEHTLAGLKGTEIKNVLKIFNVRIFEEASGKIKEIQGEDMQVRAFATRGILGELAGDIGNACYTAQKDIMTRTEPSQITPIIFTSGEGFETKLIGSMLILENTINSEPVFILRAINPSEEFISKYSVKDFLQNAISYAEVMARAKGVKLIVAPVGQPGSLSNRTGIHNGIQDFINNKARLDLDVEESFNGFAHNITKGVVSEVKLSSPDSDIKIIEIDALAQEIQPPAAAPQILEGNGTVEYLQNKKQRGVDEIDVFGRGKVSISKLINDAGAGKIAIEVNPDGTFEVIYNIVGASDGSENDKARRKSSEPVILPTKEAKAQLEQFISATQKGKYQEGAVVDLQSLSSDKKIIFVGDLHGRLDNLKRVLNDDDNFGKLQRNEAVLVIEGDAVHSELSDDETARVKQLTIEGKTDEANEVMRKALSKMDSSVEIMQFIMDLKIKSPDSVYYLLGNHDYLSGVFSKGGIQQGLVYKQKLIELYGEEYVTNYEKFIALSPIMAVGRNFVGFHGGPPATRKSLDEIKKINVSDEFNPIVFSILWGRPETDYSASNVREFLEKLGLPSDTQLIVGHSPTRDGNWHWQPMNNLHVIFAGHDRTGYAVINADGIINFIDVTDVSPEIKLNDKPDMPDAEGIIVDPERVFSQQDLHLLYWGIIQKYAKEMIDIAKNTADKIKKEGITGEKAAEEINARNEELKKVMKGALQELTDGALLSMQDEGKKIDLQKRLDELKNKIESNYSSDQQHYANAMVAFAGEQMLFTGENGEPGKVENVSLPRDMGLLCTAEESLNTYDADLGRNPKLYYLSGSNPTFSEYHGWANSTITSLNDFSAEDTSLEEFLSKFEASIREKMKNEVAFKEKVEKMQSELRSLGIDKFEQVRFVDSGWKTFPLFLAAILHMMEPTIKVHALVQSSGVKINILPQLNVQQWREHVRKAILESEAGQYAVPNFRFSENADSFLTHPFFASKNDGNLKPLEPAKQLRAYWIQLLFVMGGINYQDLLTGLVDDLTKQGASEKVAEILAHEAIKDAAEIVNVTAKDGVTISAMPTFTEEESLLGIISEDKGIKKPEDVMDNIETMLARQAKNIDISDIKLSKLAGPSPEETTEKIETELKKKLNKEDFKLSPSTKKKLGDLSDSKHKGIDAPVIIEANNKAVQQAIEEKKNKDKPSGFRGWLQQNKNKIKIWLVAALTILLLSLPFLLTGNNAFNKHIPQIPKEPAIEKVITPPPPDQPELSGKTISSSTEWYKSSYNGKGNIGPAVHPEHYSTANKDLLRVHRVLKSKATREFFNVLLGDKKADGQPITAEDIEYYLNNFHAIQDGAMSLTQAQINAIEAAMGAYEINNGIVKENATFDMPASVLESLEKEMKKTNPDKPAKNSAGSPLGFEISPPLELNRDISDPYKDKVENTQVETNQLPPSASSEKASKSASKDNSELPSNLAWLGSLFFAGVASRKIGIKIAARETDRDELLKEAEDYTDQLILIDNNDGINGGSVDGTNHQKYRNKAGQVFLFKESPLNRQHRALVDEFVHAVSKQLGFEDAMPVFAGRINGKFGVFVEWIENEGSLWNDVNQHGKDFAQYLSKDTLKKIAREQVLDWLVSQHDSHAGSFLTGKDGKVYTIDKSQAFKYMGFSDKKAERLATDYNPNGDINGYNNLSHMPIYNIVLKTIADGKANLTLEEAWREVLSVLDKVDEVDTDEYIEKLTPYAKFRFDIIKSNEEVLKSSEEFLKSARIRKEKIRRDFEVFYNELGFKKPKPAAAQEADKDSKNIQIDWLEPVPLEYLSELPEDIREKLNKDPQEKIEKVILEEKFIKETLKNIYGINNFSLSGIEGIHIKRIGMGMHNKVYVVTLNRKNQPKIEFVLKVAHFYGSEGDAFEINVANLEELEETKLVPRLGAYDTDAKIWSEEYINTGGKDLKGWRKELTSPEDSKKLEAIEEEAIRAYYLFYQQVKGYIEDSGPGNVVITKDAAGNLYAKVIDIGRYKKITSGLPIKDWFEPFLTKEYNFDLKLIVKIILEENGQEELLGLKQKFPEGNKWKELRTILDELPKEMFALAKDNTASQNKPETYVYNNSNSLITYLARHKQQMEDFRKILPDLIKKHIGDKKLRIGVVGPATGEEMATILAVIIQEFEKNGEMNGDWGNIREWDIKVKGIEMNRDHADEAIRRLNGEQPFAAKADFINTADSKLPAAEGYAGRVEDIIKALNRHADWVKKSFAIVKGKDASDPNELNKEFSASDIVFINNVFSDQLENKETAKKNEFIAGLLQAIPQAYVFSTAFSSQTGSTVLLQSEVKTHDLDFSKSKGKGVDLGYMLAVPKTQQESTPKTDVPGGIDLRALPITTQPMSAMMLEGLSPVGVIPLQALKSGDSPQKTGTVPIPDKEWQQIENMVNAGIKPSLERIREYLILSCKSADCQAKIDQALSGMVDILRLEEEHSALTDAGLKEILILLESNKSAEQLSAALSKIVIVPQELVRI